MSGDRYTAEQVVEAVRATGGVIAATARHLNCGRRTIYRYRDRYQSVRQALEDEREQTVDLGEQALRNLILDPNHPGHTTAVIFLLKTLGKQRGYVERVQVEKVYEEITEVMVDTLEAFMSPEGFREAIDVLVHAEHYRKGASPW